MRHKTLKRKKVRPKIRCMYSIHNMYTYIYIYVYVYTYTYAIYIYIYTQTLVHEFRCLAFFRLGLFDQTPSIYMCLYITNDTPIWGLAFFRVSIFGINKNTTHLGSLFIHISFYPLACIITSQYAVCSSSSLCRPSRLESSRYHVPLLALWLPPVEKVEPGFRWKASARDTHEKKTLLLFYGFTGKPTRPITILGSPKKKTARPFSPFKPGL